MTKEKHIDEIIVRYITKIRKTKEEAKNTKEK